MRWNTDVKLPGVRRQAERLVELGVHSMCGYTQDAFVTAAGSLDAAGVEEHGRVSGTGTRLLVLHPEVAAPSALTPLLRNGTKSGFVVRDMVDLDDFSPRPGLELPPPPMYLLGGISRGDELLNRTPDEALGMIDAAGRTPLVVSEGIFLLLQRPELLERGRCFMTIGSRLEKPGGRLDARTPAIWISNGTGRDGAANRDAPKVGWCWAGNRHQWLGIASARTRGQ